MIEAARLMDGSAPIDAFLLDLERDRELEKLADVAVRLEDLARFGTLNVPVQLNSLGSGIFEVKAVKVRLLFYYVEGHTNCKTVRLTNGFIKGSKVCPPRHIRRAMRVRGEDQQQ
jgi:hypothetical protein